jgi:phosphatidylglycerophosphatase A
MTSSAADLTAPRRPTVRFLLSHPAHGLALGFGSGLSRWAPGTVGTLWAWLTFAISSPWLEPLTQGWVLLASWLVGWWACTITARNLGMADPGAIVWDEVVAFWLILWVLTPASFGLQVLAFATFRVFDAVKPGPVAWADAVFKGHGNAWVRGLGILMDDLVAAACTLMVMALLVFATGPIR